MFDSQVCPELAVRGLCLLATAREMLGYCRCPISMTSELAWCVSTLLPVGSKIRKSWQRCAVPRERFVAPQLVERAHQDTALPIEADQSISQPYIVALM